MIITNGAHLQESPAERELHFHVPQHFTTLMPLIRFAEAKIVSLRTDFCFPELSPTRRAQRSNTNSTPPSQPLLNSALHRLQPQRLWAPKQLKHPGPSNFRAYHWHWCQRGAGPARKDSRFSLVLLFALWFFRNKREKNSRKHPTISVPSLSQYQDLLKPSSYYPAQSLHVFLVLYLLTAQEPLPKSSYFHQEKMPWASETLFLIH